MGPRIRPEDDGKEESTSIPGREPKTKAAWKSFEQIKKRPAFQKKSTTFTPYSVELFAGSYPVL